MGEILFNFDGQVIGVVDLFSLNLHILLTTSAFWIMVGGEWEGR